MRLLSLALAFLLGLSRRCATPSRRTRAPAWWPMSHRSDRGRTSPLASCSRWTPDGTPTGRIPARPGFPTHIHWTLPAGFEAGEIQWPLPNKYIEAGDVLTYGYKDETMLLVPMRVDASVKPGTTVTLRAAISWLECETICLPGETQEKLTLRVDRTEPSPAETELFVRYRALLPRPYCGGSRS